METKKNFSRINEELFADVVGTIKVHENAKAMVYNREAFAIVDSEVISLDKALKENKNCMAIALRAVGRHAGKMCCGLDTRMMNLLREQLYECVGKQFTSISVPSKNSVLLILADYLSDVEPCMLVDVISTVNSIYSNGFIISAE